MANNKAQGLSINTIIIAAIALIVLVVLVAIFTGRLGLFSKGLGEANTCVSLGGDCQADLCKDKVTIYGSNNCGKDLTSSGGLNLISKPHCCKI